MSVIAPCIMWVPILWGQILGLFTQNRRGPAYQEKENNTIVPAYQEKEKNATVGKCCQKNEKHATLLPDDVMIDIFSRVPAECVFQCQRVCRSLRALTSTPSFVEMHLSRSNPGLVIHSPYWKSRNELELKIEDHFIDHHWGAQKIEETRMKFSLRLGSMSRSFYATHFGSYNGLLMFCNLGKENIFFICNPITSEQVAVKSPSPDDVVCGLFLHSMTREYRILYMHKQQACFGFIILSLGTKCSRPISTFSHPPLTKRPPTIINGVLYWVVDEVAYRSVFDVYPDCSDSIVSFNTETEDFRMTPLPPDGIGRQYNVCCGRSCQGRKDLVMQLMEMEGNLCLCLTVYVKSVKVMEIWVLKDDYANQQQQLWVKMHTITLDEVPGSSPSCFSPLYIQDGVIILKRVLPTRIYFFHLQLRTYRMVHVTDECVETIGPHHVTDVCVETIGPHRNSLVSLCTDNLVLLQHSTDAE